MSEGLALGQFCMDKRRKLRPFLGSRGFGVEGGLGQQGLWMNSQDLRLLGSKGESQTDCSRNQEVASLNLSLFSCIMDRHIRQSHRGSTR